MRRTKRYYENIAGSLSKPSKMPGYGYGLPALASCATGTKLAKLKNTVCAACYACRNRYRMDNVQSAQSKRLASITHPDWVEAMVFLIRQVKETYFRWHDSGDIVSLEHLSKICQIAREIPECRFWLPTQEHALVAVYISTYGPLPDNLTVRLSTPKIDGRPVTTTLCTSSVHTKDVLHGHECPAPKQNNQCGDCRACWNKEIKNVSYRYH
jgi:Gene product 88